MPEDSIPSSGEPDDSPAKPKVRRISNKAPRKGTEEVPAKETQSGDTAQPEANADSASDAPAGGKADQKRSNRRRRGKGKPSGQAAGQPQEIEPSDPTDSSAPAPAPASTEPDPDPAKTERPEPSGKPQSHQRPPQPPRRKLDPERVAKNAWKIYLAEVSEEGVALIADGDARELARRCFRLSEIFLEEADRRS